MNHRERGRRAFDLHGQAVCPTCDGTGRVGTMNWETRSRKGGNAAYRKSLEDGQISMAERGRLGGARRLPRLGDPESMNRRLRRGKTGSPRATEDYEDA